MKCNSVSDWETGQLLDPCEGETSSQPIWMVEKAKDLMQYSATLVDAVRGNSGAIDKLSEHAVAEFVGGGIGSLTGNPLGMLVGSWIGKELAPTFENMLAPYSAEVRFEAAKGWEQAALQWSLAEEIATEPSQSVHLKSLAEPVPDIDLGESPL